MKLKTLLYSVVLLLIFTNCNGPKDEAKKQVSKSTHYSIEISDEKPLPLSSGSGITGYSSGFLVVGDDTPWMYYMDSLGVIFDSLRISNVEGYVPGIRMPGVLKPDFESIIGIDKNRILIMSSGSSNAARDTAYIVNPLEKEIIFKRSMGDLFRIMADSAGFEDRHFLNIEGSSVAGKSLYYFNRGDFSGKNFIFKFNLSEFISWFVGESATLPSFETFYIKLPSFKDSELTFSSAYFNSENSTFTYAASSELGGSIGADGVVTDGVVAGTSFGFVSTDSLTKKNAFIVEPITKNGKSIPIKIEGFWPVKQISESATLFYGVSDPDDGTTVLYSLIIQSK